MSPEQELEIRARRCNHKWLTEPSLPRGGHWTCEDDIDVLLDEVVRLRRKLALLYSGLS